MVYWRHINRERAIARIKTIIERIKHDASVSAITSDLRQLLGELQFRVDSSSLQALKARFDDAIKKYDASIKLVAANAATRSAAAKFGCGGAAKFGNNIFVKKVRALIADDGNPLPPAPTKTPHKEACDAIVRRLL
jgi:hypothetical protein